uniref:Uncharacterized protein n=1 Tax=Craspedostauros australis TaxID=1486917 RepID=A0A7R9ZS42_9STRA
MVGSDWQRGGILQSADDIEVWHTWLDHHHVSTFGFVQGGLDQCFAAVGWVLLVGLLVAESWVAVKGVTEWPVVRGGVLGGVGEDGDIGETFRIQSIADCLNASVLYAFVVSAGD